MSSLSGSVSLKLNVGVVETPVAPDDGADKAGALGAESIVKVKGDEELPATVDPDGSSAVDCQQYELPLDRALPTWTV